MMLLPLYSTAQVDTTKFCKMRAESDARYMAYRQQGLDKDSLIQLENERIDHIAKENNAGLDFADQYKRFIAADIAAAYEIAVGETKDEKLQIVKDYVVSRMSSCVTQNSR